MSIDKLNKLIREFQGDVEIKDGLVESINSKTNRVVKPEDTAKNGEFTYRDGSPVKEGTVDLHQILVVMVVMIAIPLLFLKRVVEHLWFLPMFPTLHN